MFKASQVKLDGGTESMLKRDPSYQLMKFMAKLVGGSVFARSEIHDMTIVQVILPLDFETALASIKSQLLGQDFTLNKNSLTFDSLHE